MQTSDNERQWVAAYHVPLNIAAMHVSGVLLCVGLFWIPAASAETYTQTIELMLTVLLCHVAIQIPAGLLASFWAARGQTVKAGLVALGLATAATCALYVCAGHQPATWPFWWQTWGCLCVSLSSYVGLCTLRRSTVERRVERFKYSVQTLAMWALLRPPRCGPR
ncbi:hypothetical protein [Streptomyces sp. NPDC002952]|uniref:hypothetical protein n=1 Tax=Streptomyces sp. NPDC002952 TaxID=3364673 RepID=UPI003687ECE3